MSNANVFLPTLERLSQLVLKQYGCNFHFLDTEAIAAPRYADVYRALAAGDTARTVEFIYFPIMMGKKLSGAVEIFLTGKLDETSLHRLDQTVRLVLQSSLENINRLDKVEEIEQQLRAMKQKESLRTEAQKIVSLDERRRLKHQAELPEAALPILETMSFPFLIEAQTTEDAFKMALEVHQLSGRRIFLPIEDLSVDTFESGETLRALGGVTLYTSKVESLNRKIQRTLVEYYEGDRKKDDPQIIVATTLSYADLKHHPDLIPDFVNRLAVGYLLMRQSFQHYKSEDIMEFFVDSLTGRAPQ